MKYVEVGGARMSAIGLGTWQFGSTEWGYGAEYSEREADRHRAAGPRRRASPCSTRPRSTASAVPSGSWARRSGTGATRPSWPPRSSPSCPSGPWCCSGPGAACDGWGSTRIDLYQLHQPNPVVPLSSTMPAFAQLLDEGLVRHAGVSNYSLARWQAAEEALGRPVLSNQVPLQPGGPPPRDASCCRGRRRTTG